MRLDVEEGGEGDSGDEAVIKQPFKRVAGPKYGVINLPSGALLELFPNERAGMHQLIECPLYNDIEQFCHCEVWNNNCSLVLYSLQLLWFGLAKRIERPSVSNSGKNNSILMSKSPKNYTLYRAKCTLRSQRN